ncbi:DExH-box ATP-dependent RNA helicase [Quillaja saponaria]|uniref:DExH-box ATP-dependent RNA helicase n=1 Tax=Quillaja saponaria TaxID=32244 RepID=A0AAD7L320_QUISA|nr:DExH-box ATP-dependent RNA helicase [Quillaja saponaria]
MANLDGSLVLTTESRSGNTPEPTGESESLWVEKAKKKKKKVWDPLAERPPRRKSKRHRFQEESLLTSTEEGVYQSKTKETRVAYEALLSVIQEQLGGRQLSIVSDAANKILVVLKNETIMNPDKKKEIEKMLNPIPNHVLNQLVSIGRLITDFQDGGDASGSAVANGDDALDDDMCVALEFDIENKEEDSDLDVVQEDDEIVEPNGSNAMLMGCGIDNNDMWEANEGGFNVQDIDACWIQRKISLAYEQQIHPEQCQKLAEEVLKILAEGDDREVENKLLLHLHSEKFPLIKYLLQNRLKIVWCIRLGKAENQDEMKKIAEEIVGFGPYLAAILEQLHATRATAMERQKILEKCIREEARPLKDKGRRELTDRGVENCWLKGQHQSLDLENLAFEQGRYFLEKKKCGLPEGSFRRYSKGYEEIHVPKLNPKPLDPTKKLIKVSSMPDWAQPTFKGMTQLNRVQSKVYKTALFKADNVLLCAPTRAGKLMWHYSPCFSRLRCTRILIVDSTIEYDVKVRGLSEDQTLTHEQIDETQIIVTTPEKWDIITRESGTNTQLVKLFIIDKIHLLHDNRGPVLESVVARTVRQIETTKEHIRLVGLSATLPIYKDVALFLRVDLKKGLFHFDNSYRPVPLAQQYIGIRVRKPLQRFQLMNDVCYEKVMEVAGNHQILIFVHSRKETAKTAYAIRDIALANDLLSFGFAIHHEGMTRRDSQLVEDLVADGHVQVLVSTGTLAWGTNLPAHTVIFKGTQVYNQEKGSVCAQVMQILGRAGRPQYDSYGEGIIITGHSEMQYYLSLMNQQLPTESQFVSKLADQRNAETVLGTVQNAREACNWIGYTHLYVRMLRNPTLYGLAPDIYSAATILDRNNLVKNDRKSGYFQVTDLGRIASYHYITHGTISTYNEHLKPTMGDEELCWLFSLSEEFKYVTVRPDEKTELAKLLDRVPIPIKESLEEPSAKINVLLQAYILELEGLSLTFDMVFITQNAGRLMHAIFEIVIKRGWAQLAEEALNLCKMVNERMWGVQIPLRQFNGIANDILMKLEMNYLAWESYHDLSSQEIGELIHAPNMGRILHKFIPKLNLAAYVQPITRIVLRVELTITPDFKWEDRIHGYVEPFWVIVEDNDRECILHHEYFMLKKQHINEDHTLSFTVPIYEPLPSHYFISVVSDRWLDSQTILPASFRHLILPEKYPPPTELLDLRPLPVAALRNPSYEALLSRF